MKTRPKSRVSLARAPKRAKNRMQPSASEARVNALREAIASSEKLFTAAKSRDERQAAATSTLLYVHRLLALLDPPILAPSLHSLAEQLSELLVGRVGDLLQRDPARAPLGPPSKGGLHGTIAAAVAILSEGGERRGNLTRENAARYTASALKAAEITDRGKDFDWARVRNIYLA